MIGKTIHYLCFFILILIISCKNDASTPSDTSVATTDSLGIDSNEISVAEPISLEELVEKDVSNLEEAQVIVQKLLEACATSDFREASKYLAYLGGDETRMYNDVFNYDDSNEKMVVDITAGLIKDWLSESESYEFISFEEIESDIGIDKIQVVEVMFNKQDIGINRRFFRLKETPKGLLVVAMD